MRTIQTEHTQRNNTITFLIFILVTVITVTVYLLSPTKNGKLDVAVFDSKEIVHKQFNQSSMNNIYNKITKRHDNFELNNGFATEKDWINTTSTKNDDDKLSNIVDYIIPSNELVVKEKAPLNVSHNVNIDNSIKKLVYSFVDKDYYNKNIAKNNIPELKGQEELIYNVNVSSSYKVEKKKTSSKKALNQDKLDNYFLYSKDKADEQYVVKAGDSIQNIASNYGYWYITLARLNNINPDTVLIEGQKINVTNFKPYIDIAVDEKLTKNELVPFTKKIIEDPEISKGEEKIIQEGASGIQQKTYDVSRLNGQVDKSKELLSNEIKKPIEQVVHVGTKSADGSISTPKKINRSNSSLDNFISGGGSGGSGVINPTYGGHVIVSYGYPAFYGGSFHNGADLAGPYNPTIRAAISGTVVYAGWGPGGYGYNVVIQSGNMYVRTAHMSRVTVSTGQNVSQGQGIGIIGSTGRSSAVHCHFEIHFGSVWGGTVNPMGYI